MSTTSRIIIFGTASGLVWSLVPGFLSELFSSTVAVIAVLVAGIITGILVSFVLHRPLMRFSRWVALLLAVVSLPAGGFFFGVFISIVGLVTSYVTGEPHRFVAGGFHPFLAGLQYAVFSVVSMFGIVLVPSAVVTTLLLRWVLLRGPEREIQPI